MTFKAILASCIEAIEDEESVESCLANYPEYAERLEPFLRIIAVMSRLSPLQRAGNAVTSDQEFRAVLTTCIKAIEDDESVDACLAAYPREADRLEPLLRIVMRLPRVQPRKRPRALVMPAPDVGQRVEQRVPSPVGPRNGRSAAPLPARGLSWSSMPTVAAATSLALILLFLLQSAAFSLPGDFFYPLKRAGEEVQGAVVTTFGEAEEWHMIQVERRVEELASLDAAGRPPDPALVEEVQGEIAEVVVAAAALPPAEREPELAEWLQRLHRHNSDSDEDGAVAAVLAEPLATAAYVLDEYTERVAQAPVPILPSVGTPTPGQASIAMATAVEPEQLPTMTATRRPTPTITPRVTTSAKPTLPVGGTQIAVVASPTASDEPISAMSDDEPIGVTTPSQTATPTATPVTRSLLSTTPTTRATATGATTAVPLLLPTVTPTPLSTLTATATRQLALSTPEPTDSLLPTVTPTPLASKTPLPTTTLVATETSEPANTPLPTVTYTLEPTNTPLPAATATAKTTNTPLPTMTMTAVASNTPLPTATATPQPTNTPLLTKTSTPVPTNTSLPTATSTSAPTNTSLPTATDTPEPTNTPLPTATSTSVPTTTSLPTATDTPEPTNTPLPTATDTPEPTNTSLPTATDTPEPTNTSLPTATDTPEPTNTPLPTATDTPEPTNTPLPTATSTPEPTNTSLPTETPASEQGLAPLEPVAS